MKITVTAGKPQDNKVVATLVVAAADVNKVIAAAYKDIANRYNFQGFRKGKTPRPVIDGIVGKEGVLSQATNELLKQAEPLMLEELNITPVGEPNYGDEPVIVVEGSDYTIEVTIPVRPEVELDSYDAPSINMPPQEVTDAEIYEQIDLLLSYRTSYEDIDEDRGAQADDIINIDIENVENAERFAGTNRMLALNDKGLPEGFNEGLIGMKKGETKEITWSETHDAAEKTDAADDSDAEKTDKTSAHDHKFAVKVTLNAIKKSVVPELTDELAEKGFGFKTVAELRDALKSEIASDKEHRLPTLKENRVLEAMTEHLKLDEVPADYANQVFNEITQNFLAQLQAQGATLDSWLQAQGISPQAFIADLHEQADQNARQSLTLEAIAAKQGFEATEQDIRDEFAKAQSGDPDELIEDWRKSGQLPAVRSAIKRHKALDWLVENAKVTEVDEVAERRAARNDANADEADTKTTKADVKADKADKADKAESKKKAAKKPATKRKAATSDVKSEDTKVKKDEKDD